MSKINVNNIEANDASTDITVTTGGSQSLLVDTNGKLTVAGNLSVNGNNYPSAGPLSNRNLIINGAMQVAQRGTSIAITSSSEYTLDRFAARLGGSYTVGATVTQESDGPSGFANCLKVDVTSTSTPATSENFLIEHRTESQDMVPSGWGASDGKSLILSFWVKSNKTGTYSLGILFDNKSRNWLSSYTISSADTWEYKTVLIDADTATAFDDDNNVGLRIGWHLSTGPDDLFAAHSWQSSGGYESVTGQVNLCDSTSNYWQITGVQLEVGDTATPFEHRSYGDELARCQRYFHSHPSQDMNFHGFRYNSTISLAEVHFPTTMRASPTVSQSGNGTATSLVASINGFTIVYNDTDNNIINEFTADAEL